MFKKPFIAAAIILAVSVAAWPQVQGKLMGVVKDGQGNPVEKASVHIVSTKTTSVAYDLTTNKEGRFLQVGIQPGYFQVTVKKDGFMPRTTETRVSLAGETNVEFKLDTADEVALRSVSAADKVFLNGNKLYGDQKYAEAAAAYEEAVGMSQTNWGYFLNLGLSYKKLDRKDESLAAFRKAVELSPESYSANKELGEVLAKGSAFDEAKKYYQKAVELSPDDPDAHYNLGACLTNTGEQDAALEHFRKTAELKADYADAYYQMGTIYIGRNMVPEAVQSLEKFLELAPSHEKAPLAKQLLQYLKK
ncbi:MAG TPA: tetratricopeptide repeat protein [Acidobacteriota bacterium]|nr:tetratricopeptide repeat protein [Acidobacteriota bacterium]